MAGPIDHVQFWTTSYWTFGWEWDGRMHAWRRNDAGAEHIDAGTHRVLSATSVLVQYVKEDIVYAGSDPGGYPRRYHHLVGQGPGHALRRRQGDPGALVATDRA